MTEEQPNLSRRRMLITSLAVPTVAAVGVGIASPAEAAYNSSIKRSDVIRRAKYWFNKDVPYNRAGTHRDDDGKHYYRRDCSGFVSMAWHTVPPGYSTRTIPNIAPKIAWSNLKAGDAINHYDDHVFLFHKWASGTSTLWYYDLTSNGSNMRHSTISVSWLKSHGYIPRRYKKIVAG